MYLAIDIGGSKTLVAIFTSDGDIKEQQKFPTPKTFAHFKEKIAQLYQTWQDNHHFETAGIAIPGIVDRSNQAIVATPNLSWQPSSLNNLVPIPLVAENDANAAALAEAQLGAGRDFQKVLYLTISTGFGMGVVADGQLDHDFDDSEGGHMYIHHNGELKHLEEIVSGSALKQRFGQYGYEITDPSIWQTYGEDLAVALVNIVMIVRPDVVVLGGGVAVHFEKFIEYLRDYAEKIYEEPFPLPPIKQAEYVETAVVYGAYLLAKGLNSDH